MHKIAILLPSYMGDIQYVERLIPSYKKHNVNKIPLYLFVPQKDKVVFEKFIDDDITLLNEEEFTMVHDNSIFGIRPGYINQEIIKLSFWEKGLCENYFCVDSDGVFIRDFHVSDFMYDENTPYTILVEDNELVVEPEYYKQYWSERKKLIRLIQEKVGLNDKRMLTCHGFAILSCKVFESFNTKFMKPNNLNYKDLLNIAPYEFSWYNMWLQKDKTIKIEFREPIFKYFHTKNHHLEYLRKGITLQDISRGYMGVVINSNYSREYGVVSYEDGDIYDFSMKEMMLLSYKIIRSPFRRVKKILRRIMSKLRANVIR